MTRTSNTLIIATVSAIALSIPAITSAGDRSPTDNQRYTGTASVAKSSTINNYKKHSAKKYSKTIVRGNIGALIKK